MHAIIRSSWNQRRDSHKMYDSSLWILCKKYFKNDLRWDIKKIPQVGLEPTTFGLEVQRAIHCATGAWHGSLFVYSYSDISFKSTRSFRPKIFNFWLVYLGPDFFTVSKRHHHRWSERIIWAGVILGTYSVVWVPWWPCRSVYWWVFDREVALKVDFIKNSILWVVFEQTDHLNFRENRFNTRSEIEFKILNR